MMNLYACVYVLYADGDDDDIEMRELWIIKSEKRGKITLLMKLFHSKSSINLNLHSSGINQISNSLLSLEY